ncbi:MAG: cytochrome c biogenesis protein CcdA [Candidatus Margulisiibacteriota bacterium]
MEFSLIIPAFIAGLLTFLAPCTLPLVPGYLEFISGVSLNDLKDQNNLLETKKYLNQALKLGRALSNHCGRHRRTNGLSDKIK